MRYTKITVLFFVASFLYDSSFAQYTYSPSSPGGGITFHGMNKETIEGSRGDFGLSTHPFMSRVDSNARYYPLYPMSADVPQTNLQYYPGAEKISIDFNFDTAVCNIKDMRYSITSLDSTINTGWRVLPEGRWVPQGGSVIILFANEKLACKDKVLLIKLYNINNPESVVTQIVSTRRLETPRISVMAISNLEHPVPQNAPNNMERYFNRIKSMILKGRLGIAEDEYLQYASVLVHTTNTPFILRTYLIRNIKGVADTIHIPANWEPVQDASRDFIRLALKGVGALTDPFYKVEIPPQLIAADGQYQLLVSSADYQNRSSRANLIKPVFASSSFEIVRPYMLKLRDVFLGFGVTAAVIGVLFMISKQRQRRRLQQAKQVAREARLSLQAVQSQLNPHFIFNALAGIQNLLNKQDNEKANAYLTTFSRLTRSVLNSADKELVPLKEEAQLLKNYLQMEQLRFGFKYEFHIAADIDDHNTELPPMLVQPFIENAVKHGIAAIREKGMIQVEMLRETNDLVIVIKDNGKGFDTNSIFEGKGLALSKNRVSLLNTVYGGVFGLTIQANGVGTVIQLKIENWLK